jgi:anti-sigma factor RsiW
MSATPAEACERFADLLDALADDELPQPLAARVAGHLAHCPRCAAELAAIRDLRGQMAALRFDTAPPMLRRRLEKSLPAALPPPPARRRAMELAACGALGAVLGAGSVFLLPPGTAATAEHDLVAAHARALLAQAPPQLAASDPHQVRPWLSVHLPVAPRVVDAAGYPLLGARLDLVAGMAVAAILYRRRAHAITVFAAPAATARGWPTRTLLRQGFNLLGWVADGVRYVAVSDLNRAELAELAGLLGAPP